MKAKSDLLPELLSQATRAFLIRVLGHQQAGKPSAMLAHNLNRSARSAQRRTSSRPKQKQPHDDPPLAKPRRSLLERSTSSVHAAIIGDPSASAPPAAECFHVHVYLHSSDMMRANKRLRRVAVFGRARVYMCRAYCPVPFRLVSRLPAEVAIVGRVRAVYPYTKRGRRDYSQLVLFSCREQPGRAVDVVAAVRLALSGSGSAQCAAIRYAGRGAAAFE